MLRMFILIKNKFIRIIGSAVVFFCAAHSFTPPVPALDFPSIKLVLGFAQHKYLPILQDE